MKTLGYCGLNCEECPVFVATANNDNGLRQKTAREWSKLYAGQLVEYSGKNSLSPEDMNCSGCQSESGFLSIHQHAKENLDGIRKGAP